MLSGISRASGSRSESGSLDGGLALGVVSLRVRASHLNLKLVWPGVPIDCAAPCQSSRQPSLEGGRVNLDLAEGIEEPDSAETTATDPLNPIP